MTDKAALRRELRAARRAFVASLAPDERKRLEAALRDIVLPRITSRSIVGSYVAVGDEIDPSALTATLPAGGVAVPAFADRAAAMTFRHLAGELEPGPFGVPQPPAVSAPAEPGLLLVPLVGADPCCRRIGQGAGHYDRYLAENRVPTIGLAWDVQIVGELPDDPWDIPLDAVATPTRWIVARGDGPSPFG